MTEFVMLGHQWWTYPRGWRDVARCVLGRHRRVLTAVFPDDDASPVARCSCGALWQTMPGGGCWLPERRDAWKRRKGGARKIEDVLAETRAVIEATCRAA